MHSQADSVVSCRGERARGWLLHFVPRAHCLVVIDTDCVSCISGMSRIVCHMIGKVASLVQEINFLGIGNRDRPLSGFSRARRCRSWLACPAMYLLLGRFSLWSVYSQNLQDSPSLFFDN